MAVGKIVARGLAPIKRQVRPQAAVDLFRSVLSAAIDGKGRFQGATAVGERALGRVNRDIKRAVHDVIEQHVRLAGAQGFVTSLGGFAILPITLPANITGLAVLQARMVASIAYIHGYDLTDPRVRTAVTACLLGEETVEELVRRGNLPSTPLALATAPVADPELDNRVATELGAALTARIGGKRLGISVTRRVPLLGGGVGAVVDAVSTHRIGRYAEAELPDRKHLRDNADNVGNPTEISNEA
jgi:uncharacterized protein (DUF697 family)